LEGLSKGASSPQPLLPHIIPQQKHYLKKIPPMIKFENSKFKFTIRGFTLARRVMHGKLIKHKIVFFYLYPWNDLEGLSKGASLPQPLLPCILPPTKTTIFIYFPSMIKFENFEFIFSYLQSKAPN